MFFCTRVHAHVSNEYLCVVFNLIIVSSVMSLSANNLYKGYDRAFCVRMKSTLTKRGCHFKSSGYRVSITVSSEILYFQRLPSRILSFRCLNIFILCSKDSSNRNFPLNMTK